MTILLLLQSYDATTHFESTVMDVLSLYTQITGKVTRPLPPSIMYFIHLYTLLIRVLIVICIQTVDLSVDLSAASAAEE